MRSRLVVSAVLLFLCTIGATPALSDAASDCSAHLPWGLPSLTDGAHVDLVCHTGYISALDNRAKDTRWVAYDLTGPHTLGCFSRAGLHFKVDDLAPASDQARLADYSGSGYDLGHMAPNQDFAWDQAEQRDSFSFANVAPQLPGLNRQGWERGEEYVRAWAYERGELEVYVGPILGPNDKTLGDDAVDIPSAFFKVVVDPKTGEGFGFVMPQRAIKKGPLSPFLDSISDIETQAHVTLPLPTNFVESKTVWHADLAGWKVAHKSACSN